MANIPGRDAVALLVIDVQNDVVGGAYARDEVVGTISGLVDRARDEKVPVVWVQHEDEGMAPGSDGWGLVPELTRHDDEPLVRKRYGDSFEDTDLGEVLERLRVGRLVVVGAQTDICVRSTLHGAMVRGYDTTLVEDAHTTEDLREWGSPIGPAEAIAYTNLYWQQSGAPGRTADAAKAADVTF